MIVENTDFDAREALKSSNDAVRDFLKDKENEDAPKQSKTDKKKPLKRQATQETSTKS